MLTYEQAQEIILANILPAGSEKVQLVDAVGRVLAEDIASPWDMPRSDNSAMDGFAVRSADCTPGCTLTVTDYIPAGTSSNRPVAPGEAARIMTGAPLPPDADAVVPLEETQTEGDRVTLLKGAQHGSHVRFKAEDVACGDVVIPAGTVLGVPQVSMLASSAKALVPVFRRVRVAILSTGDELVELGTTPQLGEIVNSNTLALAAAVKQCGAEPVIIGTAKDEKESHLKLIAQGLKADLLITSAGVSAGDRDLVRETLAELGVRELFWKVLVKPGSPTAFGMMAEKPVFSLPGNPVATMITFEEFVRPALLKMMGHRKIKRRVFPGVLTEAVRKKPGNLHFLRVHVYREGDRIMVSGSGDQKTGILRTMLHANALALLPADRSSFAAGEEVPLHLLDPALDLEE